MKKRLHFLQPPPPCRHIFSTIRGQFRPLFDPSPLTADVVYGRPLTPLTSYFQGLMMLLRTIKHFCETTSVHGLGFIVEAKSSLIKRIAWFVIFLISISYAGIQLKENVDSKLT